MAEKKRKPLGERLIELGVVSRDQLELALREQKRTGVLLGEVLNKLGFASEDIISSALATQAGVEHISLENYHIDEEVLKLVPESFARKNKLIPFSREGDVLRLAMANTFDVVAIDELQRMTGSFVEVISATETDISSAIEKYYSLQGRSENIFEEIIKLAESETFDEDTATQAPIIRLIDQLIGKAIKDEATDLHLEPEENLMRTRFRIDGVLHQGISLPKKIQGPATARIKIMADLNISEKRLPQDGRIKFKIGKKDIDLRVSTFPTVFGENIVLRILDKSRLIVGLERLGLSPENLNLFRNLIEAPNGIILVTGPTGSGKTTTLYSSLSYINSLEKNIITLEDPVEYNLPVIRQSQINLKAGLTFPLGLRSILRQDPDVILVGEMRDGETAEMAIRAALTGHLVFSTLHTNDAVGAIPRLIDMGIEPFLVASSVNAILAQRLLRKICLRCKEKIIPDPNLLIRTGLRKEEYQDCQFYQGKGCPECNNTGYKGRMAIFEIFPVSPELRTLIMQRKDSDSLLKIALAQGMKSLSEDAKAKALAGITTLEEVFRVTFENSTALAA